MAFRRHCPDCNQFFNTAFFTIDGIEVSLQYCPCCHVSSIGASDLHTLLHLPISKEDLSAKFFSGEISAEATYEGSSGKFLA